MPATVPQQDVCHPRRMPEPAADISHIDADDAVRYRELLAKSFFMADEPVGLVDASHVERANDEGGQLRA